MEHFDFLFELDCLVWRVVDCFASLIWVGYLERGVVDLFASLI